MGEGGVFGSNFGLGTGLGAIAAICGPAGCEGESSIDCARTRAEMEMLLATVFASDPAAYARGRLMFGDVSRSDPCGLKPRLEEVAAMGLFDDIVAGIGNVVSTVSMNAPAIGQLVQTVQQIINPATGSPMNVAAMTPAAGMMGDGLDAFRAACAAQPGCTERLAAELRGMNATTGSFDINAAGVGSALANPAIINILRGLGLGAVVGAGGELVSGAASAIGNLLSSGPASRGQGPVVMAWPAGVPYPRGIVFRAPDRPEKRYRTQGAALLNSGDVAAAKRVRKAAGRARRGTRRSSPRNITPVISAHSVCGKCLTSPCVGGH